MEVPYPKAESFPYVAISNFARSYLSLIESCTAESEHAGLISAYSSSAPCYHYKSGREVSLQLDECEVITHGKRAKSSLYDYDLIYSSLMEMREARWPKDYRKLCCTLIRTKWTKYRQYGWHRLVLRHAYVWYQKASLRNILGEWGGVGILDQWKSGRFDDRYLLGMLIQTRKNIGRTALVLLWSTFGIFRTGAYYLDWGELYFPGL